MFLYIFTVNRNNVLKFEESVRKTHSNMPEFRFLPIKIFYVKAQTSFSSLMISDSFFLGIYSKRNLCEKTDIMVSTYTDD